MLWVVVCGADRVHAEDLWSINHDDAKLISVCRFRTHPCTSKTLAWRTPAHPFPAYTDGVLVLHPEPL